MERLDPPRPSAEATLWKIWEILKMWDPDHQWSADEIEFIAEAMLRWTGSTETLPPPEFRSQDDEYYVPEADLYEGVDDA